MKMMMAGRFGGEGREGWGGSFGGMGGGPRGRHGGPGGGRRGGRMFAGGELRLLLLHLVAEQPRHGYDLIRAVEELAGGGYAPSPGVVYPTLALLVDEGLIAETPDGEGSRKAFAVTDAGRAELTAKADEVDGIVKRIRELGEERQRSESPPIRRAMGNLAAVLGQRAMAGGFDKEAAHQIAEILDDAARRIERL